MHSVPEFPEKISEFAKDFICQCLRKHPGDRPTVMELLHHPWVRTFQVRHALPPPHAPLPTCLLSAPLYRKSASIPLPAPSTFTPPLVPCT